MLSADSIAQTARHREKDKPQVDYLDIFCTTLFSHPNVEGIANWGFWDGRHWGKCAPLFGKDWSPKQARTICRQRVSGDWWADGKVSANQSGESILRAFHGEHTVTVELECKQISRTATLGSDGGQVTLRAGMRRG